MTKVFKEELHSPYTFIFLKEDTFRKLDPKYFISGCTETIKYMCANQEEIDHLIELGCNGNVYGDYIKIYLNEGIA